MNAAAIALATALALAALLAGCSALVPKAVPPTAFFALERAPPGMAAPVRNPSVAPAALPTLIVETPRAAAGLDSARIVYLREAHRLEYFAHSEWVAAPARMLAPLVVDAIDRHPGFAAVVPAPSAAVGDLRLETEILRLQQEFGAAPSRTRFTLRATLVDETSHRVLAGREFDRAVAADAEDARGGVAAANSVVQIVLDELAAFCADAARGWRPAAAGPGGSSSGAEARSYGPAGSFPIAPTGPALQSSRP